MPMKEGARLGGDRYRPPKKKQERQPEPQAAPEIPKGPFRVLITQDAQREYDALSGNVKELINELIDRLKGWPSVSGIGPIFGKGYAPNKFRMKTWDWRMEFLVDPAARKATIIRVGHRDTFYDEYHP